MLTILVFAVIIAAAVVLAIRFGKVKDANNNFIPDALEEKVAEVKEEVKQVAKKVKNAAAKKPVKKSAKSKK